MYKLTLTPNRANPRRFVRMVIYRREGDRVVPYLVQEVDGKLSIDRTRYRDIAPAQVDPELQAEWAAHVRAQLSSLGAEYAATATPL